MNNGNGSEEKEDDDDDDDTDDDDDERAQTADRSWRTSVAPLFVVSALVISRCVYALIEVAIN